MFSFIWVWINGWVNNHEAGDLRRYCTHYDVTVMSFIWVWNVVVTSLTAVDSHNLFTHICHDYFTDTGAMVHLQKSWLWNWQIQTYKKITSKLPQVPWSIVQRIVIGRLGNRQDWEWQADRGTEISSKRPCSFYIDVVLTLSIRFKSTLLAGPDNMQNHEPHFDSLPSGQHGCHFADDIFRCIFMNEKFFLRVQ